MIKGWKKLLTLMGLGCKIESVPPPTIPPTAEGGTSQPPSSPGAVFSATHPPTAAKQRHLPWIATREAGFTAIAVPNDVYLELRNRTAPQFIRHFMGSEYIMIDRIFNANA